MPDSTSTSAAGAPVRVPLKTYSADIQLTSLAVGIDNIRYDVYLSPRFVEISRKYIQDLFRQTANVAQFYGMDARSFRPPETIAFRKLLTDVLQASLTQAQFNKNIELDLLMRLAVVKHFTQEMSGQFTNLLLECKERIRSRGEQFDRSERAYVLRARLNELQADRRNIYRQVGQQVFQILTELEEGVLAKLRKALFGDEFSEPYSLLKNRLLFVEGGRDDLLQLEHYVLTGNFVRDQDRFETFEALLLEFLRDSVLAETKGEELASVSRSYEELSAKVVSTGSQLAELEARRDALRRGLENGEGLLARIRGRRDPAEIKAELADVENRYQFLRQKLEQMAPQLEETKSRLEYLTEAYRSRLGDLLHDPLNARRLFDAQWSEEGNTTPPEVRDRLLDLWTDCLEQRGLLIHVLASYEVRNLHLDYCPPVHLQQLKRALVFRDDQKQVEDILRQFPAKQASLKKLEEASKALRRYTREEARNVVRRFAEDFIRLRRDSRNYQRLVALMERVNLIQAEPTRELSRLNNSLYEILLPDEARPAEDRVVSHAIIKADVRGSTRITQDLLARGLNPASHFSLNLYTPVKRILERYGAAKVFIEGDAIILAIYETESNRAHQRAVAKACVLAREILSVSRAYNSRVEASDLPRLELGVGVAFQNSAPTFWIDSDSRIMISRAINLSDRLSSCAKVARRLIGTNASPFNVFLFETVIEGVAEEETEELMIRYNLNGIELNEEGFAKLGEEVALNSLQMPLALPWGTEDVTLYVGHVPIGESLEPIVVRKGVVRRVRPNRSVGEPGTHAYYEVCTNPKVLQIVEEHEALHRPPA